MDTLKQKLEVEKISAMKEVGAQKGSKSMFAARDLAIATTRLSAIRAALTGISKVETSFKDRRDLTDEEVVTVLRKEVAQRVESARVYGEAGETERQDKELAEADVLRAYLPQLLDLEATRALVASIIEEKNLAGMQSIGQVMGTLKARSDVDKGAASGIARELLGA